MRRKLQFTEGVVRYFRLFPDCHLVRGPARASIYFLTRKKRYHLSGTETEILDALLGIETVESVLASRGAIANRLLDMLITEALGAFFEQPVVSEPYFPKSPMELRGVFETPPVIEFLHLQITNSCDANCAFCANSGLLPRQGCNSCARWSYPAGERLDPPDLAIFLEELDDLDVRNVVISGGNPLIEADRFFELVARLRESKPDLGIIVHSNGGAMCRSVAETLKSLSVHLAFSVFGTSPEEYARVTGNADLFNQMEEAVLLCRKLDIGYSITVILSPATQESDEELLAFGLSIAGCNELSFTEFLPRHENWARRTLRGGAPFGGDAGLQPSSTGPGKVRDVGTTEYVRNRKHNFCLNGRVAVALDGSVMMCPAWPEPIMNIRSGAGIRPAFRRFTSASVIPYWEMDKGKVPGCRDCENRYGCGDCAVLERETFRDVGERSRFCDYDPEKGHWCH